MLPVSACMKESRNHRDTIDSSASLPESKSQKEKWSLSILGMTMEQKSHLFFLYILLLNHLTFYLVSRGETDKNKAQNTTDRAQGWTSAHGSVGTL